MRQKLRENGFNSNPCIYKEMRSIDGNELDEDLVDLKYTAEENYKRFKENFFENGKYNAKISKQLLLLKLSVKNFKRLKIKRNFILRKK